MEDLLNDLGLSQGINFEELPNCTISNLDKDKILVICKIHSLKDIDIVINRLPGFRKQIMDQINNNNNKEFVQDEKIPMSKFLWDMYVIGLHQVEAKDKSFKATKIAEYERDRFIARKIIIQYEHFEELKQKFNHLVFPETVLNSFPVIDNDEEDGIINFEEAQELLSSIESVIGKE